MGASVMPINQARSRLSEVIKTARYGHRPVLIGTRGRAEVAVIDIDLYRALEDQIEEVLDRVDARAALGEVASTPGRDAEDVFTEIEARPAKG
jgi:prevent-host-death family protein